MSSRTPSLLVRMLDSLVVEVKSDAVSVGVVDTPAQQEQPISTVSRQVILGFTARYSPVEIVDSLGRNCARLRSCPTVNHRRTRSL